MASIRDREAGRDFEGNGPSSFDPRDYRRDASDCALPSEETVRICAEAVAQIERAFSPEAHAKWLANQAAKAGRAA